MFFTYDRISRIIFWGCVSAIFAEISHVFGITNCCCLTFITLWLITAGTYMALASLKLPPDGCLLANAGGEGAQRLRDIESDRLVVLQLDVTKQDDIDKAITTISETLKGKEVLWGVINNAGIATYGAVEWVSMATYRKVCEVNLFGTIALTKACLPLIRKAKGRVLTTSSARGRMASPLGTTYEVTKFAIEGFSDGLRQEMKAWGVDVSIIEPGNYVLGTSVYTEKVVKDIADKMWNEMDDGVKQDYGGREAYDKVLAFQTNISSSGFKDVSPVVEAMTDGLTQRYPQGRYQPMGIYIYFLTFISQHFPEWVYDYICLEILMKKGW